MPLRHFSLILNAFHFGPPIALLLVSENSAGGRTTMKTHFYLVVGHVSNRTTLDRVIEILKQWHGSDDVTNIVGTLTAGSRYTICSGTHTPEVYLTCKA